MDSRFDRKFLWSRLKYLMNSFRQDGNLTWTEKIRLYMHQNWLKTSSKTENIDLENYYGKIILFRQGRNGYASVQNRQDWQVSYRENLGGALKI